MLLVAYCGKRSAGEGRFVLRKERQGDACREGKRDVFWEVTFSPKSDENKKKVAQVKGYLIWYLCD